MRMLAKKAKNQSQYHKIHCSTIRKRAIVKIKRPKERYLSHVAGNLIIENTYSIKRKIHENININNQKIIIISIFAENNLLEEFDSREICSVCFFFLFSFFFQRRTVIFFGFCSWIIFYTNSFCHQHLTLGFFNFIVNRSSKISAPIAARSGKQLYL